MAITPGTFAQQWGGFSGPGQGIIDQSGTPIILPATEGDAAIGTSEGTFEVTYDETGDTPREVYSMGMKITIDYPMKIASLEGFLIAFFGNNYTMSDTEDPDASAALTARKSGVATTNLVHKKTPFTFDFFRRTEPVFSLTDGSAVTRTADTDLVGFHLPNAVAKAMDGAQFTAHNGESVYAMQVIATLPLSTDTLIRVFNTDLALA